MAYCEILTVSLFKLLPPHSVSLNDMEECLLSPGVFCHWFMWTVTCGME